MKVLLKAIAQVMPNSEGIEAPSRLENPIIISETEFSQVYADTANAAKVSFADDGISDPQVITTYTGPNPVKGRYIVK